MKPTPEQKRMLFLVVFCLFLFLFQFFIADRVLFGDDYIFATFAKTKQFFYTENAHPPLPVWSDILLTSVFGLSNRTMRLTSILFATFTLVVVYFFAKQRTTASVALLAVVITGISAWHIRASQMNSGSDGGMFTFFFLLTLFLFSLYLQSLKQKLLILSGISLGFALLSKETGVLLFPILLFCYFFQKNSNVLLSFSSLRKLFSVFLLLTFLSLFVWSIFPILDLSYNNGQNMHAILERIQGVIIEKQNNLGYYSPILFFYSLFKILLWCGPFLLFFPLLWYIFIGRVRSASFFCRVFADGDILFVTLLFVTLFYFVLVPSTLDRTRYLMVLIPVLCILCAEVVFFFSEKYSISRRDILFTSLLSLLLFALFFFWNSSITVVSFESVQNPVFFISHFDFNFSLPVFTETDNSGFLLNFRIFLFTFVVCSLLFCLLCFFNPFSSSFFRICLLFFFAVSLSYNLLITEEYAFHLTSPNYSNGVKELILYAHEHQLSEPLYLLKNYELQYYLQDNYTSFVTMYGISETDASKLTKFSQALEQQHGTILFTDMPPIDKNGLLWETIIEKCVKEYSFSDKGVEVGYVLAC